MPVMKVRNPIDGTYVPLLTGSATDHGSLQGLGDDDHPQYLTNARGDVLYVKKPGDQMTGPLTFLVTGTGANGPNDPAVHVSRSEYPAMRLTKSGAAANRKNWKIYISDMAGAAVTDSTDALSFAPEADDLATGNTIRMYRDGRLLLGGVPIDSMDAATKKYVDDYHPTVYYTHVHRDTTYTSNDGVNAYPGWESAGSDASNRQLQWSSSGIVIPETGVYIGRFMTEVKGSLANMRVSYGITLNGTYMDYGGRMAMPVANSPLRPVEVMVKSLNAGDVMGGMICAHGGVATGSIARLNIIGPLTSPGAFG